MYKFIHFQLLLILLIILCIYNHWIKRIIFKLKVPHIKYYLNMLHINSLTIPKIIQNHPIHIHNHYFLKVSIFLY